MIASTRMKHVLSGGFWFVLCFSSHGGNLHTSKETMPFAAALSSGCGQTTEKVGQMKH